jgi:hypothetical protein
VTGSTWHVVGGSEKGVSVLYYLTSRYRVHEQVGCFLIWAFCTCLFRVRVHAMHECDWCSGV